MVSYVLHDIFTFYSLSPKTLVHRVIHREWLKFALSDKLYFSPSVNLHIGSKWVIFFLKVTFFFFFLGTFFFLFTTFYAS